MALSHKHLFRHNREDGAYHSILWANLAFVLALSCSKMQWQSECHLEMRSFLGRVFDRSAIRGLPNGTKCGLSSDATYEEYTFKCRIASQVCEHIALGKDVPGFWSFSTFLEHAIMSPLLRGDKTAAKSEGSDWLVKETWEPSWLFQWAPWSPGSDLFTDFGSVFMSSKGEQKFGDRNPNQTYSTRAQCRGSK